MRIFAPTANLDGSLPFGRTSNNLNLKSKSNVVSTAEKGARARIALENIASCGMVVSIFLDLATMVTNHDDENNLFVTMLEV